MSVYAAAFRGFNPTLVRLRLVVIILKTPRYYMFQSHAGSIEAQRGMSPLPSISMFQSHAGSIEAQAALMAALRTKGFNPTLVRLRPVSDMSLLSSEASFNPTLVRLRLPWRTGGPDGPDSFQSHAGSIEAWRYGGHGEDITFRFNPTLVRLRP